MEDQIIDNSRDALTRAIGSIGKWQITMCLVVFLVKFPVAWHQMSILFLAPPMNFTCGNSTDFDNQCYDNCTKYTYDHRVFAETIKSEWDLVCNRAWLSNLTQTLFMLGILVGNMVFGHLSDRSAIQSNKPSHAISQFRTLHPRSRMKLALPVSFLEYQKLCR